MGLSVRDTVLAVVPMFHANAWGLTFSCPAVGAKLVMPGSRMDGPAIFELLETEGVTLSAAVPTVWQMLLAHLRATGEKPSTLKRVVIGGSAVPEAIIRAFHDDYGVEVVHAWGMTETSPLGSVAHAPVGATGEDAWRYRDTQGRLICEVEARLVGDAGTELPLDGEAVGEVEVRGPWITGAYYKDDDPAKFRDGWLRTGDVGTIDRLGYVVLTDRAKDVIKSGGEWISSVDIENELMAHPKIAEAAVIGVPHPRWDERPLACVVVKAGETLTAEEVLDHLRPRLAKWQLPDDVVFIDEVPKTSVGKFSKKTLRERFAGHALPS
jgi:fatty-acyl-CoA synthase